MLKSKINKEMGKKIYVWFYTHEKPSEQPNYIILANIGCSLTSLQFGYIEKQYKLIGL